MLAKRDPIFWAATAIFALALLLGATVDNGFLLLGVAAYLLRPTIHSMGFARKLIDERQLSIQYQASNVAFAALVFGNIVVILHLMSKGDQSWTMLNAVLLGAIAVRALAGLLLVGDPAVAGPRIAMAVGAFLALFGAMEGEASGIVSHIVPGALLIALGYAARRWPRAIAITLLAIVTVALGALAFTALQSHTAFSWGSLWALALINVPLVVAAFCMLRGTTLNDGDLA